MMPRYCRAEKLMPKSISVYIKVFGMNVELNIFFTEKNKNRQNLFLCQETIYRD